VTVRVVLEVAPKRAFASALDWPGWSRGARDPEAALDALLVYADRYAPIARGAGEPFATSPDRSSLEVAETLDGGSGTEFGVPSAIAAAEAEAEALAPAERTRQMALLRAVWDAFDAACGAAEGVELRKGPRGGGRDLDKIRGHVLEAELAYLGQLGSRPPPDLSAETVRQAFVDTLEAVTAGAPLPNPRRTKRPWPPRYAIRRAAWHVLDHAWEVEDRAG
jgi:hypothetical protein